MITAFKLLCDRCGLSHREAAEFLSARIDTVKSWSSGRNTAPDSVIDELRELYETIEAAADKALESLDQILLEHGSPDVIEIGVASDDEEARSLGLPCAGAHAAVIGTVIANADAPVKVVPRGATLATAAASDAHGA